MTEWLIAAWFGIGFSVTALFSLLVMASKQSDDSDRLASQHDRYLALIPGERRDVFVVHRPYDWNRDEEAS